MSYLFIAHDLAAVAHMSHTIAVMYLGKIVEWGDAEAVALEPKHPYTQALFAAALPIDLDAAARGHHASPARSRARSIRRAAAASTRAARSSCLAARRTSPALRTEAGRLVACHLYGSTA